MSLTAAQTEILTRAAERDATAPDPIHTGGDLRIARALARQGMLTPVPDTDDRAFRLTDAGADAYDQLPADVHARQTEVEAEHPYVTAVAALRARQAADAAARAAEAELRAALLNEALAAHAALAEYVASVAGAEDVPEQGAHWYGLVDAFRVAEDVYTDRTGLDPFVGLTVTLPETGDHAWIIANRSRYHGTCELRSAVTGTPYPHWVSVEYALSTTRAWARLVPVDPARPIPATYLVEKDDLGDGFWEVVAKGPTGVGAESPIEMGIVAREIEERFRNAGCTTVVYRVTVTVGNRETTAYTPQAPEPCDCSRCVPARILTVVPDLEEPTIATTDQPADDVAAWLAAAPASVSPPQRSPAEVHVWQSVDGDVFVQADDGPLARVAAPAPAGFDTYAANLLYGVDNVPTVGEAPAGQTRVYTRALGGKVSRHVPVAELCAAAHAWIDPAPEGVDDEAWATAREILDLTEREEILGELDKVLAALAVRLGVPGLVVQVSVVDAPRDVLWRRTLAA